MANKKRRSKGKNVVPMRKKTKTEIPKEKKIIYLDQSEDKICGMKVKKGSSSASESTEMKATTSVLHQKLICIICQEILYKPVSIAPCLHTYCHPCITAWIGQRKFDHQKHTCPDCRGSIECLHENHVIKSIVEAFEKDLPSVSRSKEDLEIMARRRVMVLNEHFNYESESEDEDYSEGEQVNSEDEASNDELFQSSTNINPQLENAIQQFVSIAGVEEAIARQYVSGAWVRNLSPLLERALSYYYDQQG